MSDWQIAGLAWLVMSIVLAPIIGRLLHDRDACPTCQAKAARRKNAHRWYDHG